MNARLRARLARPRRLPPPQGEGPTPFGTIIRRTRPRRRVPSLAVVLLLAMATVLAYASLFYAAREGFTFLIFGGIR